MGLPVLSLESKPDRHHHNRHIPCTFFVLAQFQSLNAHYLKPQQKDQQQKTTNDNTDHVLDHSMRVLSPFQRIYLPNMHKWHSAHKSPHRHPPKLEPYQKDSVLKNQEISFPCHKQFLYAQAQSQDLKPTSLRRCREIAYLYIKSKPLFYSSVLLCSK